MGPDDRLRVAPAEQLLPRALATMPVSGVTRLADITRLDRLGLPVWQAVRPLSRALSVHQGKGATAAQAKVGALLEAFESHAAESFAGDGPTCSFAALPTAQRAPDPHDFARNDTVTVAPDTPCRWVPADNLHGGGTVHLPFELVSLDFTRGLPSVFDRSSNGVGAGATRDEAVLTALHEIIERDALVEWYAGGLIARTLTGIDPATIGFGWFAFWHERLAAMAIDARFFFVPSITGTPVIACQLSDTAHRSIAYRTIQGFGCHPSAETALFRALAEAVQCRATCIAGAREDLLREDYAAIPHDRVTVALALPLPPSVRGIDWRDIRDGPIGLTTLIEALAAAGYPAVARVDLAECNGIAAVRVFVCGLGGPHRRRRSIQ